MLYVLKRRDDIVTVIDFLEDGTIYKFHQELVNPELAPLHDADNHDWLKQWWKRRAVPVGQGHIRQLLERKGLLGPEDYLLKNLGLSLTDYYWISPLDSGLTWKDVNLFENEFHEDILIGQGKEENKGIPHYTPNSSLQGSLEKCWTILDGERGMIKGNRDQFSSESINEVIATKLHELQGFANYTEYKLIKINGKEYDYGCYSKLFTSTEKELITAYDVVSSEKQPNDISPFEHFIRVSGRNGMDVEQLQAYMDYMIMSDFVLSGRDRHLSNVAILRDAESLRFISPAPIYDSGKSLFVQDSVPTNDRDLLSIKTESFVGSELKMLKFVKDRNCLDVSKLPERKWLEEVYAVDSKMDENRIKLIGEGYERKIELFRRFQLGEDLNRIRLAVPARKETRSGQ
ncbi:MAG: hypothetical protein ACI4EE_12615 [Lachnospiraceae bacterium]